MRKSCQKHYYKGTQSKSNHRQILVAASFMDWLVSYWLQFSFSFVIYFTSYLFFVANLWNILTLSSNVPTPTNQSPLSSLSISVLLVLINHCTSPPPPKGNPYRTCISSLSGNNNISKWIIDKMHWLSLAFYWVYIFLNF